MPIEELHKKKLKKNLTILAMILLWCALIWAVTMIKIANAADADNYKRMSEAERQGEYLAPRAAHLEKLNGTHEQWVTGYHDKAEERENRDIQRDEQRVVHQDKGVQTHEGWIAQYHSKANERQARDDAREQQRKDHFAKLDALPPNWWDDWSSRQPYDD